MARLRRSRLDEPGIGRRGRGRGFTYVGPDGRALEDLEALARARSLVIPPAWRDVWICPWPNGHVQAVGTDSRGRRQYLYHEAWRRRRDREKFDRVLEFARRLPRLRERVEGDLAREGMPEERVLAAAVRLLDLGFFRIGGERYAEENESFGLATLLKEHVRLEGDLVVFDYTGKSGKERLQAVADPDVVSVVGTLKRRRGGGPELLAWKERGRWVDLRSEDVNAYLGDGTGGAYTSKDFRTWNATVLAAVALAVSWPASAASPARRRRAEARAVKEVAGYLGNTPAVCRGSYIDPRVFDRYRAGETIRAAVGSIGAHSPDGHLATGAVEAAVIDLVGG